MVPDFWIFGGLSVFCRSASYFARGGVLWLWRVFYRLSVVSRRGGASVRLFCGSGCFRPFRLWFGCFASVRQLGGGSDALRAFWLRISSAVGFYFVSWVLLCLWSFRRSVVVSCIRFDLWRLLGVVSLRRSGCFWV